MSPWMEAIGALGLALSGAFAGHWAGRQGPVLKILSWAVPLAVLGLVGLAVHVDFLGERIPLRWLLLGRIEHALVAWAAPTILFAREAHLKRRTERILFGVLLGFVTIWYGLLTFALPAIYQPIHQQLKTDIDPDGVCIQQTGYTCGPAAAVTALRRLGVRGEEGELAIRARTTPSGTPEDRLAEAIEERHGSEGISCEVRRFGTVGELRDSVPVIAVVKYRPPYIDHCVTVLEVTERDVVAGDPLKGLCRYSIADFEAIWRYRGVIVRRTPSSSIPDHRSAP